MQQRMRQMDQAGGRGRDAGGDKIIVDGQEVDVNRTQQQYRNALEITDVIKMSFSGSSRWHNRFLFTSDFLNF